MLEPKIASFIDSISRQQCEQEEWTKFIERVSSAPESSGVTDGRAGVQVLEDDADLMNDTM